MEGSVADMGSSMALQMLSTREWVLRTHHRVMGALLQQAPQAPSVDSFTTPDSLSASSPWISTATRLSNGVKIYDGGVCICHTPGSKVLQRMLCAKSPGGSKDTFGNRFEVH